jgi:molybdate transport system ATP-binding protein
MSRPTSTIAAGLGAEVLVERPGHRLDVRLQAEAGEVVAVVGPNGSGKTTLLRALAGLQTLSRGRVALDGRVWEDPSTGVRLSAQDRRVGMVLQDVLLFPHLTAAENVAFGPRSRGRSRADARRTAGTWLDRLGIGDLADRRPHELSGGQAQRVGVARALATEPALLLLDEPLAALDVGAAMALRLELARHLAAYGGITMLVTHDALDAMTVANRVVVLDDGGIVQDGTPAEVAALPRTPHVARLVGLNVLDGESRGSRVRLADGTSLVTATPYDGPVHVTFPPAAVGLSREAGSGSARNQWRGRVMSVAPNGLVVRVHLDVAGGLLADVTAESAGRLGVTPGPEVWASVKATEVTVHAAPAAGSGAAAARLT